MTTRSRKPLRIKMLPPEGEPDLAPFVRLALAAIAADEPWTRPALKRTKEQPRETSS